VTTNYNGRRYYDISVTEWFLACVEHTNGWCRWYGPYPSIGRARAAAEGYRGRPNVQAIHYFTSPADWKELTDESAPAGS
jgi:hypothetical protein